MDQQPLQPEAQAQAQMQEEEEEEVIEEGEGQAREPVGLRPLGGVCIWYKVLYMAVNV